MGNPWIFRELAAYKETGEKPAQPDIAEVKEMILRHALLQIEFKGEYQGMREMRKHAAWYTKGAAKLRDKINQTESYEQLKELLDVL
jgi:tRNA-dihydrouridine synthase